MRAFGYHRASQVPDALAATRDDDASVYLAGGTTLLDLVKLDVMKPSRVVDIGGLPLNEIEPSSEGGLLIGANVRNSDLAWNETVKRDYTALSEALLSGASPQLRNMATTAGNLMQRTRCPYFRDNYSPCNKRDPQSGCAAREGYNRMHAVLGTSSECIATHPSDMCVALAVLEATVVVEGLSGKREIPLEEFHFLPGETPHREHALEKGEMILAVRLAPAKKGAVSVYLKSRDRASYEFALAAAAVWLEMESGEVSRARIALGGVGTKPWRAKEAEARLMGSEPNEGNLQAAAEAALASAEGLDYNAFKIPLAKNVLVRAIKQAVSRLEADGRG